MKYSFSDACRTEEPFFFSFLLFLVSIIMVYPKKDCYLIVPLEIQILSLKPRGFNDQEKGDVLIIIYYIEA